MFIDILMDVDAKSSNPPIACCVPLATPVLSDEEAEATAALFRALADPARVRIVNALATSTSPSASAS